MSSLQAWSANARGPGASPQLPARKQVQFGSFSASKGFPRALNRASARAEPTRAPIRRPRNTSLKAAPPASEKARASEGLWAEGLQRTTAKRAFEIREADDDDYWGIAHVHVQSFYSMSDIVLQMFLRLDRVLALHLGKKIEESRKVLFERPPPPPSYPQAPPLSCIFPCCLPSRTAVVSPKGNALLCLCPFWKTISNPRATTASTTAYPPDVIAAVPPSCSRSMESIGA